MSSFDALMRVNTKKAEQDVDKFNKKTKKKFNTLGKDLQGSFANVGAGLAGLFAAKSIVNGIKSIVNEAATMETITLQFKTITGSAAQAKAIMEDLVSFAATTPFELKGVAEAGKKLLAFGLTQQEIIPALRQLGDVAGASGANLGELTLIFGQIQAAGKLTGERLLQLQERAIPIGPALAQTMGVAESSIRDLVSSGKVTTEVFEKAFDLLNDEGNFAFNGMSELSKTLDGRISNLSDAFDKLKVTIGNKFLPVTKDAVDFFIQLTEDTEKSVKANDDLLRRLKQVSSLREFLFTSLKPAGVEAEESALLARFAAEEEAANQEIELNKAKIVAKSEAELQFEAFLAERRAVKQEIALEQADEDLQHLVTVLGEEEAVRTEAELRTLKNQETTAETRLKIKKKEHETSVKLAQVEAKTRQSLEAQTLQLTRQNQQAAVGFFAASAGAINALAGGNAKIALAISKGAAVADVLVKDSQARAAATAAAAQVAAAAGPGAPAAFAAAQAGFQAAISASTGLALGTIAAQTVGEVAALNKTSSAKDGIDFIPEDKVTFLASRGERVVGARLNEDLRGFLDAQREGPSTATVVNNFNTTVTGQLGDSDDLSLAIADTVTNAFENLNASRGGEVA